MAAHRLRESLKDSRIRSSLDSSHQFIPKPILQRLVDDTLRDILLESGNVKVDSVDYYVQTILREAVSLFAILVEAKREQHIIEFLDQPIRDKDLPFVRPPGTGASDSSLVTSNGVLVDAVKSWNSKWLENLEVKQYRVLSPVFSRHGHYELRDQHVLPFVSKGKEPITGPSASGGFGEVFKVVVHRDHHRFGEPPGHIDLSVAVKRLFYNDESENEQEVYRDLGPTAHPHITDLLFTYRHRAKLHLVFPWAKGSLQDYWEANSTLVAGPRLLTWAIQQMAGIASGLALFHEFKSARLGTTCYGRHGDIKAQNILWFPSADGPGTLKISDLGLARVHGKDSRSKVDPSTVRCSLTYSPPDADRRCRISRKWDIWSLGCLYLELVTYLLLGQRAIIEFSKRRLHESTPQRSEFRVDTFYLMNHEIVNPSVYEWVDKLKRHRRCSQMLCDVLNLIMSDMIVILPQGRSSAQEISQKLERILVHAQEDENYLAGPNADFKNVDVFL